MVGKPDRAGNRKSNINDLRIYFNKLSLPQKKEFIQKLKHRLNGFKSLKYNEFLTECVKIYNNETQLQDTNAGIKDISQPAITAEGFAAALASMLKTSNTASSELEIKRRLAGTWQREGEGKIFYYTFGEDGAFETNEAAGLETLRGCFRIGDNNAIVMEPHESPRVSGLILSVCGGSLTITLTDGSSRDYKRSV